MRTLHLAKHIRIDGGIFGLVNLLYYSICIIGGPHNHNHSVIDVYYYKHRSMHTYVSFIGSNLSSPFGSMWFAALS